LSSCLAPRRDWQCFDGAKSWAYAYLSFKNPDFGEMPDMAKKYHLISSIT